MKDINVDVPGQTEDALQQKCYFWFHNNFPDLRGLLFSVPNGGKRDPKTMKDLKATGLVNGVSDLILLFGGRCYLIELKTEKGTQSSSQKKWENVVRNNGFDYTIIRSLFDFKQYILGIITNS